MIRIDNNFKMISKKHTVENFAMNSASPTFFDDLRLFKLVETGWRLEHHLSQLPMV